jgi:hypothetical protein
MSLPSLIVAKKESRVVKRSAWNGKKTLAHQHRPTVKLVQRSKEKKEEWQRPLIKQRTEST